MGQPGSMTLLPTRITYVLSPSPDRHFLTDGDQPDPFYGSSSVIVSNNQVFVVNSGSNSFSVFTVDPTDPARPCFQKTYDSGGDFPMALAASPDGSLICVLNGGAVNGIRCYEFGEKGWTHLSGWDRSLGLNLTTPPHG